MGVWEKFFVQVLDKKIRCVILCCINDIASIQFLILMTLRKGSENEEKFFLLNIADNRFHKVTWESIVWLNWYFFKNWRCMQEGGGRRVNKCIKLDLNTLDFCSSEMLEQLQRQVPLLKDYRPTYNEIPTNVQLFRIYISRYLNIHPEVNQEMDLTI